MVPSVTAETVALAVTEEEVEQTAPEEKLEEEVKKVDAGTVVVTDVVVDEDEDVVMQYIFEPFLEFLLLLGMTSGMSRE